MPPVDAAGCRRPTRCGVTDVPASSSSTRPGGSPRSPGRAWRAPRREVTAPEPVHAGVDGEAVDLGPPLRFAVRPVALWVRISERHLRLAVSASPPPGLSTRVMAHLLGTVVAYDALPCPPRPARLLPGHPGVATSLPERKRPLVSGSGYREGFIT